MKTIIFIFFLSSIYGQEVDKSYLLYLLHKNQITKCIEQYQIYSRENKQPDFSILNQIGLSLLQKGIESDDEDIQMLSLLGAGLSANTKALEVLEKGLSNKNPQIQMISLHFLSKIDDKKTVLLFVEAMRSNFLPIRMEAAFYLAEKKHAQAIGQIEALMHRLPALFKPYFPALFALNGTREAILMLKKFIHDPNPSVRIETILSLVRHQRDDFLPLIRKRLVGSSSIEQEICALAVGLFQDKESIKQLEKLALSKSPEVSLSAMKSLYLLGKTGYQKKIESLALRKNVFAINALSDMQGSEDSLYLLTFDKDIQVRINACFALLKRRDDRVIQKIEELLFYDQRELALQPISSLGKAHMALRCIPSSLQNTESRKINLNLSFAIKESILEETLYLDRNIFLQLAKKLFDREQNPLVSQLVSLLENLKCEEAIELLQTNAQKPGAPLIRTYCQLALFRMKEKGPFHDNLCNFIEKNICHEMIELKPILSWNDRIMDHSYRLTSKETTQLLVDSFSALANAKDEKSINCLLNAIKTGNPKNRFALAGLLLRAVE